MNMKNLICLKAIAFNLLLSIAVCSCHDDVNKEIEMLSQDNNSSIVQGNMLTFNSQSDFDNAIQNLKGGKKVNFPADFKSFSALYASKENMSLKSSENSDGDNEDIEEILSDFDEFAQLLNEDREVMVDGIIYKISEYGTFFAPAESYNNLVECAINFNGADYALTDNDGYYVNTDYPDVNLYNTFRITELPADPNKPVKVGESPIEIIYWPSDNGGGPPIYYKQISDNGTWAGKVWDSIWGFSKNEKHYFSDDSYRARVKFYSLDFLVYAKPELKQSCKKREFFGYGLE
jgi:hypothetical protein